MWTLRRLTAAGRPEAVPGAGVEARVTLSVYPAGREGTATMGIIGTGWGVPCSYGTLRGSAPIVLAPVPGDAEEMDG